MCFSGFLVDIQSLVIKENYCKLKKKQKTFVFVQTSAWDQISISPSVHENSMVK